MSFHQNHSMNESVDKAATREQNTCDQFIPINCLASKCITVRKTKSWTKNKIHLYKTFLYGPLKNKEAWDKRKQTWKKNNLIIICGIYNSICLNKL